jgi:Domain of unknown function (DUF3387)
VKRETGFRVASSALGNRGRSKAFTERLEAAITRYHANALTTAQVLEELIRAARSRGEETGLTAEEIAFYDALAENESARQVMGRTSTAGDCPGAGHGRQGQRQRRLGAPRLGASQHPATRKAPAAEIRLQGLSRGPWLPSLSIAVRPGSELAGLRR